MKIRTGTFRKAAIVRLCQFPRAILSSVGRNRIRASSLTAFNSASAGYRTLPFCPSGPASVNGAERNFAFSRFFRFIRRHFEAIQSAVNGLRIIALSGAGAHFGISLNLAVNLRTLSPFGPLTPVPVDWAGILRAAVSLIPASFRAVFASELRGWIRTFPQSILLLLARRDVERLLRGKDLDQVRIDVHINVSGRCCFLTVAIHMVVFNIQKFASAPRGPIRPSAINRTGAVPAILTLNRFSGTSVGNFALTLPRFLFRSDCGSTSDGRTTLSPRGPGSPASIVHCYCSY